MSYTVGFLVRRRARRVLYFIFRFRRKGRRPRPVHRGRTRVREALDFATALPGHRVRHLSRRWAPSWCGLSVKQTQPPAEREGAYHRTTVGVDLRARGPGQANSTAADDITTINELTSSRARCISSRLTRRTCWHDFSVPRVPVEAGRCAGGASSRLVQAEHGRGTYDIQCAEMCGIGHALMPGPAHGRVEQEHEAWMKDRRADAPRAMIVACRSGCLAGC